MTESSYEFLSKMSDRTLQNVHFAVGFEMSEIALRNPDPSTDSGMADIMAFDRLEMIYQDIIGIMTKRMRG